MAKEQVKTYFKQLNREKDIIFEFEVSSATVGLAAEALQVEPEKIAKTIAFIGAEEGEGILIVAVGFTSQKV
ncbi:RNA-binding protein [Bacillus gobiensis]|uniref:hypothetical protein n=1 Tax=Bacillus gobiensis TaxID=1441095 RepID=UPI003D2095AC